MPQTEKKSSGKAKKSHRARPEWNDCINDLSKLKASAEQLERKKLICKSKNAELARMELVKKGLQRQKKSEELKKEKAILINELLFESDQLVKAFDTTDSCIPETHQSPHLTAMTASKYTVPTSTTTLRGKSGNPDSPNSNKAGMGSLPKTYPTPRSPNSPKRFLPQEFFPAARLATRLLPFCTGGDNSRLDTLNQILCNLFRAVTELDKKINSDVCEAKSGKPMMSKATTLCGFTEGLLGIFCKLVQLFQKVAKELEKEKEMREELNVEVSRQGSLLEELTAELARADSSKHDDKKAIADTPSASAKSSTTNSRSDNSSPAPEVRVGGPETCLMNREESPATQSPVDSNHAHRSPLKPASCSTPVDTNPARRTPINYKFPEDCSPGRHTPVPCKPVSLSPPQQSTESLICCTIFGPSPTFSEKSIGSRKEGKIVHVKGAKETEHISNLSAIEIPQSDANKVCSSSAETPTKIFSPVLLCKTPESISTTRICDFVWTGVCSRTPTSSPASKSSNSPACGRTSQYKPWTRVNPERMEMMPLSCSVGSMNKDWEVVEPAVMLSEPQQFDKSCRENEIEDIQLDRCFTASPVCDDAAETCKTLDECWEDDTENRDWLTSGLTGAFDIHETAGDAWPSNQEWLDDEPFVSDASGYYQSMDMLQQCSEYMLQNQNQYNLMESMEIGGQLQSDPGNYSPNWIPLKLTAGSDLVWSGTPEAADEIEPLELFAEEHEQSQSEEFPSDPLQKPKNMDDLLSKLEALQNQYQNAQMKLQSLVAQSAPTETA